MAGVGRGAHRNAPLPGVFVHVVRPRPGGDGQVDGQPLGPQSHGFRAKERHGPQVAFAERVGAQGLDLGGVDLGGGVGNLEPEDVRGVEQALGVLGQPEDAGPLGRLVGAHALEHAEPVVQGVGQHVDLGVAPGDQLAVEPDEAVSIGKIRCAHVLLRCDPAWPPAVVILGWWLVQQPLPEVQDDAAVDGQFRVPAFAL